MAIAVKHLELPQVQPVPVSTTQKILGQELFHARPKENSIPGRSESTGTGKSNLGVPCKMWIRMNVPRLVEMPAPPPEGGGLPCPCVSRKITRESCHIGLKLLTQIGVKHQAANKGSLLILGQRAVREVRVLALAPHNVRRITSVARVETAAVIAAPEAKVTESEKFLWALFELQVYCGGGRQ